jgi:catechol 2,3-dioxygenase-like lactoylglutathione lyase family enzyme
MAAPAVLNMVNLDSGDPRELTEFYAKVLGWKVVMAEDDYGMITSDTGTSIGFGRIDNYTRPEWPDPDGKKRYHLDLNVDDVKEAETQLAEWGAEVAGWQPNRERWTVMLDPQGQPFCIVPAKK